MVGETNSMVGYHLMAEDHSVQLGYGTVSPPPAGPGQCLHNDDNNNNNNNTSNNIFGVSYQSQSNLSLKFLMK